MFSSELTKSFFILLHEIVEGHLYRFTPTEIIFICHLFYLHQRDFLLYGLDYKGKYYLGPVDFEQYDINSYEFYKATRSLEGKGIIIINQVASGCYKYYSFNYEEILGIPNGSPIMRLLKAHKK